MRLMPLTHVIVAAALFGVAVAALAARPGSVYVQVLSIVACLLVAAHLWAARAAHQRNRGPR